MKNDRLFQIIYILLEKQTSTAAELAEKLEVSMRTIYRDIETLSIAGIPVCTTIGKGGGISLVQGYTIDKSLLSDEEQHLILFALQSIHATDHMVDALLAKLGGVFRKRRTNWIEVDFSRWGHHDSDTVRFDMIKKAVLEKRVLSMTYYGTSGVASERQIKPIKLIFKEKSWYLQAFCLKADDFRLFKINRIRYLTLTDTAFEEDFDVPPVIESAGYSDHTEIRLVLLFSSSVGFRVIDEFAADTIEHLEDGSYRVSVFFPENEWVYRYLLTYGSDVDIIEPVYLKDIIAQEAHAIFEKHRAH